MNMTSGSAKRKTKKSTIYDIAEETGLSTATVSRILNKKGSFSPRSAALVNEAAKRLGYMPIVESAHTGVQTGTICMYYPHGMSDSRTDSFLSQFMVGASREAMRREYGFLLYRHPEDTESSPRVVFDAGRFEGLVIPYSSEGIDRDIEAMLRDGLPVAYAGRQLSGDRDGHNIYGGYIHYKQEMLELLYSLGYRSFVVFEMFMQAKNLHLIEMFRDFLEKFRLEKGLQESECRMILYEQNSIDQFQMLLSSILGSQKRPEVIVLDTIETAVSAYNIIQKAGLRIPEDIGIISTSHFKHSGEEFSPALATVYVNAQEMGRRSVQLVIRQIEGRGDEVDRNIPYVIHPRASLMKA